MTTWEAECLACGETFSPADEADLEHAQRENGTECGGRGRLTGAWNPRENRVVPPPGGWVDDPRTRSGDRVAPPASPLRDAARHALGEVPTWSERLRALTDAVDAVVASWDNGNNFDASPVVQLVERWLAAAEARRATAEAQAAWLRDELARALGEVRAARGREGWR